MSAPRPHPSSASFSRGGRSGAGVPPARRRSPLQPNPSTSPRRCEPDRGGGPRAPTLTQPLPCPDPPSLPSSEPAPAPCAAAATAAPAGSAPTLRPPPPAPQADRPRRSWSAGPLPGSLLPSLHLAPEAATATGAVRRTPTPSPGYFPPPLSREKCAVASGSSRETHHHGSGCSKSSRC